MPALLCLCWVVCVDRDQLLAAQELLEGSGEVVFEGDPASVSDMDAVVQQMLAAMGMPEVQTSLL